VGKTQDPFWLLDALPRAETGKLLRPQVPDLIEHVEQGSGN
jgi:hypothetical protein